MNVEIIDEDVFSGIRALGGELVRDLLKTFAASAPKRIAAMREALRAKRIDALNFEAHALKSASGVLGAKTVAATCATLETVASLEDASDISAMIERLQNECDAFLGATQVLAGIMEGAA